MVNMTLSIPEELHHVIKRHKEVKWSEVARSAMARYAEKLELMDKLTAKSELTEEEAFKLGELINRSVWKKHTEKMKA
ncbi:MAG: hypothetical protein ACE5J5_03195 [Candidatus Hydrothermarchaeales archaeon]